MTKADLENLGIISMNTKVYPNKFFVPCVGEVNLYPPYKMEDIFQLIWHSGNEQGKKLGMKMKCQEIKKVLELDDIF